MSWDNFKTFNSKLRGTDVFDRKKYGRKEVIAFLKGLRNDPTSYGILDSEHQKGVKTLYDRIISKPVAEVAGPVKVKYHSVESDIRDFDAALGYIVSVYPLPANHTTSDTYLPLLAIYCRYIHLMTDPSSKDGMNKTPTTACVVVGAPPNKGGVKAIMFGSTIRSDNKKKLQEHRHTQLLNAFAVKSLPEVRTGILQKYGHCAETYLYIWNIKLKGKERKFEGPVRGIAVNVREVAEMANFSSYKLPSTSWRAPCERCMELLSLGGFRPMICFRMSHIKTFENPVCSEKLSRMIREIGILRDPITKEIPADIRRIAFTEKDIDIVQPNSLDREDHINHLQWDTETLKLFDFMSLLRKSSTQTINIMFMNRENNSEDLIRKWFRSVIQNCEQVKGISWCDIQGFSWERIEGTDRNKRWRLKLRLPETHDASLIAFPACSNRFSKLIFVSIILAILRQTSSSGTIRPEG